MNKYYLLLQKILKEGTINNYNKGNVLELTNEIISLKNDEITSLFNEYSVAKKLLAIELELYINNTTDIEEYNNYNIHWWDYCKPNLINSYPEYYKHLNNLIKKINKPSKNNILFLGNNEKITNQLPCLSLIQFQIIQNKLLISAYQRSADMNLGLPSDIYQLYLISQKIKIPLESITIFIGNAHIYENNIELTKELLQTNIKPKFNLNT